MSKKKASMAQIRLATDFQDLGSLEGAQVKVPDPKNLQHFLVRIIPSRGIWENNNFDFEFTCSDNFPFERPHVICKTRVWHPNIEETGAVCLDLLRESYTPVLSISHIIAGLQFLFDEPNPYSPLNETAASEYLSNLNAFKIHAQEYMKKFCPQTPL